MNKPQVVLPSGESRSVRLDQLIKLKSILKSDSTDFSDLLVNSRRGQQVMSALVGAGIVQDRHWHR